MKNSLKISLITFITGTSLLAASIVVPFAAQAASPADSSAKLSALITKSDTAIAKRITSLTTWSGKISMMKHLSADQTTSLNAAVQTNITSLNTLKAKIDADTDLATLKADAKSIPDSLRIYALILPQQHILSGADRINSIAATMMTLSGKLQTRISAAQTAGHDTSAITANLADLNAKVSDAQSQSAAAVTVVAGLVPDNGNTTVAASNKAALVAARANIKTATADLKAARTDAKTIAAALKGFK
jgi:hypothetical protein